MSTSRNTAAILLLLAFTVGSNVGVAIADEAPRIDVASAWLQEDEGDLNLETRGEEPAERDLRVAVWHDKDDEQVYRRGEGLNLFFRGNRDAYAVAYRIDADGYVQVLWPLSRYDDGFVYGGRTYSLPPQGLGLQLEASNSKGVEYVEVLYSEYPFDLRELAIDFAFEVGEPTGHDYRIAGDPFLAVNDINFAITGLEDDQEYIVTDWTHLYVEDKVDYPRYTCTQCHHGDEGGSYRPYADSCTQVNVYYDWGWYSRWYGRFGYYPLFYDPPFYYWDLAYARPYYFHYYPVYYRWPGYNVYSRPYPVYAWNTHRNYRGDYVVRTRRGVVRDSRLYSVDRTRRTGREVVRTDPPSIRGSARRADATSRPITISRDRLVRNAPPSRSRSAEEIQVRRSRQGETRSPGIQTTRRPVERTRTIRSLGPTAGSRGREGSPSERNLRPRTGDARSRSWTKPVIRNAQPSERSQRSTEVRKPRTSRSQEVRPERRAPRVERRKPATRKPPTVKPRSTNRGGGKTVKPRSTNRGGGKTVKPRSTNRGGGKTVKPRSTNRGGGKTVKPRSTNRGGSKTVKPRSSRRSAPKRIEPRSSSPRRSVQKAPRTTAPRSSRPRATVRGNSSRGSRSPAARSGSQGSSRAAPRSSRGGGRG